MKTLSTKLTIVLAVTCVAGPSLADPPEPYVSTALVQVKKGLCLDPEGDAGASRAIVRLGECDGRPDQRWEFRRVTDKDYDSAFEIINEKSGLCLDVKGYDANERDPIILYACDKKPDQYWRKRKRDDGAYDLVNAKGPWFDATKLPLIPQFLCLDTLGSDGAVGREAVVFHCQDTKLQGWNTSALAGMKPKAPSGGSVQQICLSDYGPCFQGAWTGSGTRYSATGNVALAQLPIAGMALSLADSSIAADYAPQSFAVTGNAKLVLGMPLGAEVVRADLPEGTISVGFGESILALKSNAKSYTIGGRPYRMQPTGFYAHANLSAAFSIDIAGITATVPAGGQAELLVGAERFGPAIYLSGDCKIPIMGKAKTTQSGQPTGEPPQAIAEISSCTLGWFGTRPLPHKLSVKILDPAKNLPQAGQELSTVSATVDAAILVGGAISFAAIPGVTFTGLMAIDPDSTRSDSVTFRDLTKAKAALEGNLSFGFVGVSMSLADAAVVMDLGSNRLDFAAEIPVAAPLVAIGAIPGIKDLFSGKVYAAGRFGSTYNQVVLDFSASKIFDFDVSRLTGQLDFNAKSIAVAGRFDVGGNWLDVTGKISPNDLSLKGGAGMKLGPHNAADASLEVSTRAVTLAGKINVFGKQWAFSETLTKPKTIKSSVHVVDATIPVINLGGSFSTYAQLDLEDGSFSMRAKLKQTVGPYKADQVFTIDDDGKITLDGTTNLKLKLL